MGKVYDARNVFYKRIAKTIKNVKQKEGPLAGAHRLSQLRHLTPADKEVIRLAMV